MIYVYALEIAVLLISLIGGFSVTVKHLVRFQRRIDQLLILTNVSAERVKDLEQFLEKTTDFRAKRNLEESSLPEFNTNLI